MPHYKTFMFKKTKNVRWHFCLRLTNGRLLRHGASGVMLWIVTCVPRISFQNCRSANMAQDRLHKLFLLKQCAQDKNIVINFCQFSSLIFTFYTGPDMQNVSLLLWSASACHECEISHLSHFSQKESLVFNYTIFTRCGIHC